MSAPAARPGPATVHRLTAGRAYRIQGLSGCQYLGQTEESGVHWFRTPHGTESHENGRLTELMQTGQVIPEGWADAAPI